MLRRLIIGINGSRFSRNAIQTAISYAKRYGAEVLGVSVTDVARLSSGEPVPLGGGAFKVQRDEILMEEAQKESERWLSEFAAECESQRVSCATVQRNGDPAEVLAHESQRGDLLVLGRKGLLRLTSRPILTVPAKGVPDERPVLIAYDGSPQAAAAVQAFQLLGLAADRPIHLLHVLPNDTDPSAAEYAASYLRVHGHEVHTHHDASRKPVSKVIVEEASRLNAGVVVMGACGRRRIAEAIFGSVTRAVLAGSETALFLHH